MSVRNNEVKMKSTIRDRIGPVIHDIVNRELMEEDILGSNGQAAMSAAGPFLDLQNGFYNGLCQGLGLSTNTFQILQPTPPLPYNSDSALWAYFNNIPPYSLTQNYIASGGNQFFSDYKGLISALQAPPNNFVNDIGPATYNAWLMYLQSLKQIPAASQLPDIFFNWALINYPSVANIGSADLSAMLLDPISSAGLALMPYYKLQPDWSLGYTTLVQQLATAPTQSFNFDSSQMNTNVSNTWTGGNDSGFGGLWGGSSSTSTLSEQFASSHIAISASFAHVFTFQASPGVWYTSSAMGDAFSHQSGAPWNPASTINWQNTFDPNKGNMARYMVSLIVADTMNIQIESDAVYSSTEQQTIQNNSSAGLWPFYTTSSSSGSSTTATFDSHGAMTVQVHSAPGVPVVIGGNVIPVDQFVGHAVEGQRIFSRQAKVAGVR
jgi:hypothetical protein